ncbi:MAG: cyclopropane-fatty-acyl-phospholipid synthase family protein [Terriglobia bacterium]
MSRLFRQKGVLELIAGLAMLAGLLPGPCGAAGQEETELGPLNPADSERLKMRTLSDWEGTPLPVVEKMLELAHLRPGEVIYDLGSGDGRILILAAQKYGARGVGIELDPRRCKLSRQKIDQLGLIEQIQIIQGDVLEQDLTPADVVTVYMTRYAMQKLTPRLDKFLRDGTRVVICVDELPGHKASQTVSVTAENHRTYELRLYDFSRQGGWTSFSKFGTPR